MPLYACVAQHAITPRGDGTVSPGDVVSLSRAEAALWVELGMLVERKPTSPEPPAQPPAVKKAGASKEKS